MDSNSDRRLLRCSARAWRFLRLPFYTAAAVSTVCVAAVLLSIGWARPIDVQPTEFGDTTSTVDRILVLVPGTFAPDAEWTRPNAALVNGILQASPTARVLFVTFHWPGSFAGYQNNTNYVRHAAGQRLAELLQRLRAAHPQARIYIVAHSHGGNVALYAAKLAPKLSGIVLMGTPFIAISAKDLTHDPALASALSVAIYVVQALSVGVGFLLLALASRASQSGFLFKTAAIPLAIGSLVLMCWMVETDGTEQVWVPGAYTGATGRGGIGGYEPGHTETRTKLKQSEMADRLKAWIAASAAAYVARMDEEARASPMTATLPDSTPSLCLSTAPPDEAMTALRTVVPVAGTVAAVLEDHKVFGVLEFGLVVAAISAGVTVGILSVKSNGVVGGLIGGLVVCVNAALLVTMLVPILAIVSLIVRVPAAVPYMLSYGSLDVIAQFASATSVSLEPRRAAPDGPPCEKRVYVYKSIAGLRHSQYYLDTRTINDVATWIARHP